MYVKICSSLLQSFWTGSTDSEISKMSFATAHNERINITHCEGDRSTAVMQVKLVKFMLVCLYIFQDFFLKTNVVV